MIRLQHILAPTDFSEPGQSALKYACAFAAQFGATIHLLNVVPISTMSMTHLDVSEITFDNFDALARQDAELQLEKLEKEWADFSFPVQRAVVTGTPFVEIVRYAKANEIDMIILGTHGRGAVAHLLLGSVAERVVRKAPCPVLTVKHPEHEFLMP